MEKKKLTKKDYFEKIKEICGDNAEIVAFCDHEIELLNRKNSKNGATKNQVANEGIKAEIIAALANIAVPVTITEMQEKDMNMAKYSNQKLSALLRQLVDTQEVVKTTDKKKSYFSVVA